MRQYLDLIQHVLQFGTRKENRTGVDTLSVFNYNYSHDLRQGFPLLTTKRVSWKNIVIELLWFLSGSGNLDFLHRHGCKFWDAWADERGHLGPVYGKQWRRWEDVRLIPERHFDPPSVQRSAWRPKWVAGVGRYVKGDKDVYGATLYDTWSGMLERCYNERYHAFDRYGGRGIHVDPRWLEFSNFAEDAQKLEGWHLKQAFPDRYSLDKDYYNSNRYGPETCYWANRWEQAANRDQVRPVIVTRPDGQEFVTLNTTFVCDNYNLDKGLVCKCLRGELTHTKHFRFRYAEVPPDHKARVRVYDQVEASIAILKSAPYDRRAVISAWNPAEIRLMRLPPCHSMAVFNVQNEELFEHTYGVYPSDDGRWESCLGYVMASTEEEANTKARAKFGDGRPLFVSDAQSSFELTVAKSIRWNPEGSPNGWLSEPLVPTSSRQRLCLHLTQRSADVAVGVPYNIASYALLLHLMARFSNMSPGVFGHSLVDAHIYISKANDSKSEYNHLPGLQEQLCRKARRLPTLIIADSIRDLSDVEALLSPKVTTDEIMSKFVLDGYDPYPAIPFKAAV